MKKSSHGTKIIQRITAFALTGAVFGSFIAAPIPAQAAPRDFQAVLDEVRRLQSEEVMSGAVRSDMYQTYFAMHRDAPRPNTQIVIDLSQPDEDGVFPNEELGIDPLYKTEAYEDKGDCLLWANDLGRFEYTFTVPQTGLYNMEFLYKCLGQEFVNEKFSLPADNAVGRNNAISLSLTIDGEHPFSATRSLELDKYWQNEGVIQRDRRDNELLPRQTQFRTWITYPVKDKEGLFNEPYFFYLEAGEHVLSLEGIKVNGVAFKSVTFRNYDDLDSYFDNKPTQEQILATPALPTGTTNTNEIGSNTILVQGQAPHWRSTTELVPSYDNGTYLVSPSHHTKMRYNTVGANGAWAKAGDSLTWEFSVPANGYYRFSAKVKQNMLRGFTAKRRVLINGEVPVEEFNAMQFTYNPRWQQQSFTTDNTDPNAEDVYIYLTAGTHTITLEVVPGEIGDSMQRLTEDLFWLNYYYRRIVMITSPKPDEFFSYRVDEQIPNLIREFERLAARLREEKRIVERFSTGSGSEAATLETMAVILDRCIADPDRIPLRLQSLKDNISALSAWIRQNVNQPLELDYIEIFTAHEKPGNAKENFFTQIDFLWNGFIGSFFEDYTKLGDASGINVWVGLGRDQALTLKHLVDSDFNENPNYDYEVSINLVQGGILEAALAGKGPDVALFIGDDFPIQLAARGLTVDISQFPDYQEIVDARFEPQLPIQFTYLDGVYGLPLSQQFPMMFYRTDILEELGIEPPESWDEFIRAIAQLNRSYLGIGLLPPTGNLTRTIFEPGDTFAILQLQTGLNFYVKDHPEFPDNSRTTFDQEPSISAFTTWTEFYTVYNFEQTFDPFTRFRTGEMPIVIMPYTFYNQVYAAAPEIRGLWNMQHVPGTWREDENGERFLDISASSGGSCGLIFSKLNEQDRQGAWAFLKWLTSDETQTQFGQNMETMLGPMGRYDTANKNALANLAWSATELNRLTIQRDNLVGIPMIPANYAATRHIKNAFRSVVNDNALPRFALNSYNRDINAEIERKNAELARNVRNRNS